MPANSHIFISHASADDDFVRELRIKLELLGLKIWVDSRNLRGGDQLKPEIEQAIEQASHVLVVISPKTINSIWVRNEIHMAEAVTKTKADYRVTPLMLPGVEPAALKLWFNEEPVGEKVELEPGKLQEALPRIMAALGERLPDDVQHPKEVKAKPASELLLELSRPKLELLESGKEQLSAEAELIFYPADQQSEREVKSRPFRFIAPIGQIEQDELSWYLAKYYTWPSGLFRERANELEDQLPQWGKRLFDATLDQASCREALSAWRQAREKTERQLSVRVDSKLLEDASAEEIEQSHIAASRLQSLPWEILHDGKTYFSEGANPARIRRRLPNVRQAWRVAP